MKDLSQKLEDTINEIYELIIQGDETSFLEENTELKEIIRSLILMSYDSKNGIIDTERKKNNIISSITQKIKEIC
jgi:hypothetical protein